MAVFAALLTVWLVWVIRTDRLVRLYETGSTAVPPPSREVSGPTWRGTWQNDSADTSGRLACRMEEVGRDEWHVHFTGENNGRPFEYRARFNSHTEDGVLILSGVTTVDGDTYRWRGEMADDTLVCTFRAEGGNHGEFRLRR